MARDVFRNGSAAVREMRATTMSRPVITRARAALMALATLGALLTVPLSGGAAQAGTSPSLIAFDDGNAGVFETPVGAPSQRKLVAPAGLLPQFSPSGTELAYELQRQKADGDLTNSIVVAGRAGGAPHDLVTGPTTFDGNKDSVLYPIVWSPSGKEIAYGCDGQVETAGDPAEIIAKWQEVCVVDVATGAHHVVTDAKWDKPVPLPAILRNSWSWSPNGKDIIATVMETGACPAGLSTTSECSSTSIASIDADSGSISVLTKSSPTTESQTSPAMSPDGRHILFSEYTHGGGAGVLMMANAGGGDQHSVDTDGMDAGAGAIFSPDGKDILFTAYPANDSYNIQAFEVPVSGKGKAKQMTDGNGTVVDMAWTASLTTCTVPNLKHKTLAQARTLLKKAACTLGKVSGPKSHRPKRHIVSQSIKANRDEPAGTRVNVKVK